MRCGECLRHFLSCAAEVDGVGFVCGEVSDMQDDVSLRARMRGGDSTLTITTRRVWGAGLDPETKLSGSCAGGASEREGKW